MSKKKIQRWTAKRKMEAVLRLLRGESLQSVSRELEVTASRLSEWKENFLQRGLEGLKSREADHRDEEIKRLQNKVGELIMDNELLLQRARKAEGGRPFVLRKSRK
jgi:transposase-like protein